MPSPEALIVFTIAAVLMNISPGPSNFYVMARSISQGARAGLVAAAGLGAGALVHVAAATVGVSAVVMASAEAFTLLKWAGAGYLIWLGIQHFRKAGSAAGGIVASPPKSAATIFRESALVEILNPKTALFFLALLPQFIDPAAGPVWSQSLVLGAIVVVTALPCDAFVAVASGAVAVRLARSPWIGRWQDRVSGTILIGLGALVATGERPEAATR